MASSGSVFSETLHIITATKLEELAKQRIAYEREYAALLSTANAEQDPLKRLSILVDGAKACLYVQTVSRRDHVINGGTSKTHVETDLDNLDRFLEQARYDPSVSPRVLQEWEKCVLRYLSIQSSKYQYADLYGKLVTEWLTSETSLAADDDIDMSESFEEIPGAKKLEARTDWEEVVFEPADVDVDALKAYLENLFITNKKNVTKAIKVLRDDVEAFEAILSTPNQFNIHTLRWVICGLQSSDLLNNEKRETLKDFLSNNIVLTEIADVLNMRLRALSRWTWGDYVPLEQRRKLNGAYSVHMQEDLLQAIFLHYIGVKWSVFFKRAARTVLRSDAWRVKGASIPDLDLRRRMHYLGQQGALGYPNLQSERMTTYENQYFVHQLLDHDSQQVEMQEGEEEADSARFSQQASVAKRPTLQAQQNMAVQSNHPLGDRSMQALLFQQQQQQQQQQQHLAMGQMKSIGYYSKSTRSDDKGDGNKHQVKNPMMAKQGILHLLSTEIVVNTRLYGELTCFHTMFESWNPLLPHTTILTVLEFFGVSKTWLKFFQTFLQAPLKFMDDPQTTKPRLRKRGTPGSHTLSDVFGEVILLCLDFAVNQNTEGALLYRLYDDIWFWSSNRDTCADAWASVLRFTNAMGVRLNDAKTGSARIVQGNHYAEADSRLPDGEIRWGFLYLDPSTGRFEIDGRMVDLHVDELRDQLRSKSKSIIDWIQAWNSYATTFFSSNFGKAANCFGQEHVDKMLATHRHIQETIFEGGNVVQFLKKAIKKRFNVDNLPDGFLFFPVELGGLELKSPFVGLLQIREAIHKNPYELMDEYEEAEREDYIKARHTFNKIRLTHLQNDSQWRPSQNAHEFFSFDTVIHSLP